MRSSIVVGAALLTGCFGEGASDTSMSASAASSEATSSASATTDGSSDASTTLGSSEAEASTGTTTLDPDSSTTVADTDVECRHRVFLSTAEPPGGELGSFENASLLCQGEADAAGLGGSWGAVLSDDQPAAINLVICGDVYLADDGEGVIDDTLVATGDKWWMAEHDHAIDRHADGTLLDPMTSSSAAWTGSNVDGTSSRDNCDDWGSLDPELSGRWGSAGPLGAGSWISEGGLACDQPLHVYCLEQPG
ncbi:MAG TPA: hypothetical protein VG755_30625 [Nannocystaceae bacterium]|nr:hypothetical protein [Nannocystaceae bacterium]